MDWRHNLSEAFGQAGTVVVLGIGNELMGDDGAGSRVVKQLGKLQIQSSKIQIHIFEAGTTPENFTGPIGRIKPELVLMIDAADMGLRVGEIAWLETRSMGSMMHTTHNMPLSFLADYLTKTAGCRVAALGIQAGNIDLGAPMSPEVEASCKLVVQAIRQAAEGRN